MSSLDYSALEAYGVGDVPDWLVDEGLELAIEYFRQNSLTPVECIESYNNPSIDTNSLAHHWLHAQEEANRVLLGENKFTDSMICLEIS